MISTFILLIANINYKFDKNLSLKIILAIMKEVVERLFSRDNFVKALRSKWNTNNSVSNLFNVQSNMETFGEISNTINMPFK